MKNYFLVLNEDQKNKIQETEVEFCDLNIDGHAGVVVDEENINPALQAIGMVVVAETGTTLEGIVKVELRSIETEILSQSAESRGKVEVESWNGYQKDEFKKLVSDILVPVVQTDIILSVPHGSQVNPVSGDKFYIRIWSGAGKKNDFKAPQKIWGYDVACRDAGFKPTGKGVAIVDIETGWAVAELVKNNLYIHHDACHSGKKSEVEIFRLLLKEVVVELTLSPEEKAERQRKLAEERRRRSREQYIQECSKRLKKTLEGTRKKIADGEREVEELQRQLVRRIRELAGARRKLEQLTSCQSGELERYGKEFDKLLEVPKVRDVQVASGVIKVFTDTLYCTDPRSGRLHEIGAFLIEIYTDNGDIRWYNLTRQVDGYDWGKSQAPHINGKGKACLGTMTEIVPELVANYEFAALTMVAIQFVESVNTDDAAGKYIDRWPLAPIELQPSEIQEELRRVEKLRGQNPFHNVESDLKFVQIARKMEPGSRIRNCGDCWCFTGSNGVKTSQLAKLLEVSEGQVREVLKNYFTI